MCERTVWSPGERGVSAVIKTRGVEDVIEEAGAVRQGRFAIGVVEMKRGGGVVVVVQIRVEVEGW